MIYLVFDKLSDHGIYVTKIYRYKWYIKLPGRTALYGQYAQDNLYISVHMWGKEDFSDLWGPFCCHRDRYYDNYIQYNSFSQGKKNLNKKVEELHTR